MLEEAVDELDIEAKVMISLKIDYILLIITIWSVKTMNKFS